MNRTVSRKTSLYMVLGAIFFGVLLLNLLNYPFLGDDYVYAFMWQGQDIFTPLPEDARRIQSFSDIFQSLYSHYFTWGGRMVAHFFVMLFMWVGKFWFDIANSFMVVLLLLEMQWIAHEGRITMDIKAGHVALAFFCLWAFNFDWCHTIIWLSGACNYLWASVLFLLFLIPYIRHYFTNGEVEYGSWFIPVMFFFGLAVGDTNENTICWIGLAGIFYLWKCYRNKTLKPWMIAGFIGLSLGYGLLMLAPGNLVRLADDYKNLKITKMFWIWFSVVIESPFIFYSIKFNQLTRNIRRGIVSKHRNVLNWFIVMSVLVNFIMYLSPSVSPRSFWSGITFSIESFIIGLSWSSQLNVTIIDIKIKKAFCMFILLYFILTYCVTSLNYWYNYQHNTDIINQVEMERFENKVIVIRNNDVTNQPYWGWATGFHSIYDGFSEDDNFWRNIVFSRYYHISGIKAVN